MDNEQPTFSLYDQLAEWPLEFFYGLHYSVAGKENIEFFKNCHELSAWYKLNQSIAVEDNQDVLIENLFMWDSTGPIVIDDIKPHFDFQNERSDDGLIKERRSLPR